MTPSRIAVVGAGIAGITCARTLAQAGHDVALLERADAVGGRTQHADTPFGSFDTGAQYITVRDARFARAIEATAAPVRPWSANAIRVLDAHGAVTAAALPGRESHHVAVPGMGSLAQHWARPLHQDGRLHLATEVLAIEPDAVRGQGWQLRTRGAGAAPVQAGFDAVLLALPAGCAQPLLAAVPKAARMADAVAAVRVAPCWTLTLAFPNAAQPGLTTLGPQWNAARSTHHRIAWLARESSKPRRGSIERWTVQASPAWSEEHRNDPPGRVADKLLRAFGEVTGIRATPALVDALCWREAQTTVPLAGKATHLWERKLALGACGDWCVGHRVEDAFVSGLELGLVVA